MSKLKVNTIQPFSSSTITISGSIVGTLLTASYIESSNVDGLSTFTSSISTEIVNQNASSGSLSLWQGSQSEYDAISSSADPNTLYFVI